MDIFDQLNKTIKDTNEKWKRIDQVADKLKDLLAKNQNTQEVELMGELLLLIVEQMRPIGSLGEEAEKLQNDIINMLGDFGGKK